MYKVSARRLLQRWPVAPIVNTCTPLPEYAICKQSLQGCEGKPGISCFQITILPLIPLASRPVGLAGRSGARKGQLIWGTPYGHGGEIAAAGRKLCLFLCLSIKLWLWLLLLLLLWWWMFFCRGTRCDFTEMTAWIHDFKTSGKMASWLQTQQCFQKNNFLTRWAASVRVNAGRYRTIIHDREEVPALCKRGASVWELGFEENITSKLLHNWGEG